MSSDSDQGSGDSGDSSSHAAFWIAESLEAGAWMAKRAEEEAKRAAAKKKAEEEAKVAAAKKRKALADKTRRHEAAAAKKKMDKQGEEVKAKGRAAKLLGALCVMLGRSICPDPGKEVLSSSGTYQTPSSDLPFGFGQAGGMAPESPMLMSDLPFGFGQTARGEEELATGNCVSCAHQIDNRTDLKFGKC